MNRGTSLFRPLASGFVRLTGIGCLLILVLVHAGCGPGPGDSNLGGAGLPAGTGAVDSEVSKLGSIEVTARLVEIPEGAIFQRDLYDYATILKYEVLEVHRGAPAGSVLFVGHYNPFKARNEAADGRVKSVGGNLREFEAGAVHRMALAEPIDDHFMGGIVNKYFGQTTGPIYWALWTDKAPRQ